MPAWGARPWHLIQESVRRIQRHWADCLHEGRDAATSGGDNLRTLTLVERAYESADAGRRCRWNAGMSAGPSAVAASGGIGRSSSSISPPAPRTDAAPSLALSKGALGPVAALEARRAKGMLLQAWHRDGISQLSFAMP